ncbi:ABC-type transport auxiliary lipoprotein family protein [Alloyangia pacifica]|uniref:Cholesterol transport system auxiliary component n=1 Tax=Alloyangia pacifica TaxID=311180 RepID=A0A1I6QZW2_9RHOB|nr:ABC-type transport auxiliary lipoprotein family protein [Alloyangia pacifica]SDG08630.1 cholesterol transport system auxiliary component [Alloyangia pacifica]SFS57963.1 cholesterol transport system auxiliary component [Alloyangia pacifica]
MLPRSFLPALLLALGTSGCAAISALDSASEPLDIYELQTPVIEGAARRGWAELVVEEPIASGALSTDRIMIRPGPLQAQYLPGARWSDETPAMLQTLLVRSISETGAFASVGRAPLGGQGDYALLGELTDFQAESYGTDAPVTVHLRLMLRLVRERDSSVVASRTFEVRQPAADDETASLVPAFDLAARKMVSEILPWAARAGGGA